MLLSLYHPSARKEQGFTLIELLIVVIIIGILAAIALPLFLNNKRAAVDASVKSDVRNSVAQVQDFVRAHSTNPAVANTTEYISADPEGKLVQTDNGNYLGVIVNSDGTYKICGYNANGKKLVSSTSAWGFSSATGKFGYAAACGGAINSTHSTDSTNSQTTISDPTTTQPTTDPGTDPSSDPTTSTPSTPDPYAGDPTQVEIDPTFTVMKYTNYNTWNGFNLSITSDNNGWLPTGKDGATIRSTNVPLLNGISPTDYGYWQRQVGMLGSTLQFKIYKADGTDITDSFSSSVCSITFSADKKGYDATSANHDMYNVGLGCQYGGFFKSDPNGQYGFSDIGAIEAQKLMKGGYIIFYADGGTPQKVNISNNLQLAQ